MAAAQRESVSQLELVSEFLQMNMSSDIKVKLIDEKESLVNLIAMLKSCKLFAFHCECVGFSRNNPISLMTIGFDDGFVYLVDIQKLDFPDQLRSILSDPSIKKVMFYCRADADCLKRQHQVILEGVIDMQIMEYVIRHSNLEIANELPMFHELVAKYLNEENEKYMMDLKPEERADWGIRPLKESLIQYAAFVISRFLPVYAVLMKSWSRDEVEIERWSSNYSSSRRDDSSFDQRNPYKTHHFMPLNIINKPLAIIQGSGVSCTGCHLELRHSEFSKSQLKKKTQKCRVCKAVDVEKQKSVQYFDDEYEYLSDGNMSDEMELGSFKVRQGKKKSQKTMDPEMFEKVGKKNKKKNWGREDY